MSWISAIGRLFTPKQVKKQNKARRKLDKLTRKRDKAKAKGKVKKVDKINRKMKVVAAKGGLKLSKIRRAPRHKFRIRKGQRQEWSTKYRGWITVRRRRVGITRGVRQEIDDLKQTVESLRTLLAVVK